VVIRTFNRLLSRIERDRVTAATALRIALHARRPASLDAIEKDIEATELAAAEIFCRWQHARRRADREIDAQASRVI
jgi:hypothetical protein